MIRHGGWTLKFSTNYPEKVATAIGLLNTLVGAEYTPIAYLGEQVVNGINHAVLAEQTLLNGKDTKNLVIMVFNEKPGSMDVSLASINTIVYGGDLGGVKVDASVEIPAEAQAALSKALKDFVGSKVEPLVYVGTQVTKGINYIFLAKVTPVTLDAESSLEIVTVNSMDNTLDFKKVF